MARLLLEEDESRPPQRLATNRQLVALREVEHPVAADSEHREIGRHGVSRDRLRRLVADDEHAAARIDGKRARRESMRVDVLNERRLAGLLIDPEYGDVVRSSRCRTAIGDVDELSVRMHVKRARSLPRLDAGAVGERGLVEQRFRGQRALVYAEHLESVLGLERQERPRAGGVKVEMTRSKSDSV